MKKIVLLSVVATVGACSIFVGCDREEVTLEQARSIRDEYTDRVFELSHYVPTDIERTVGTVGGEWITTINNDPRSFNIIVGNEDPDSRTIVTGLTDYLVDYDVHSRQWVPHIASFEIQPQGETVAVQFTLRDDLLWTVPNATSTDGVAVTADDVVFWYDEIVGDPLFQHNGYSSQFVTLENGEQERIVIEKVSRLQFKFIYPRPVANPLLSSNMTFGPKYVFEPALRDGGVEAVRELFTVDVDVSEVPSMGPYHITEYTPGVRVVLERNPHYWRKDAAGTSYPYHERVVLNIVPDVNAEFLLFKEGKKDSYGVRPEDLNELLDTQGEDFLVYNGGLTLGSALIGFNQNPNAVADPKLAWFTNKRFRQAMSMLLNRERIAKQVYRGLAEPAHYLFARPNPYFNEDISLEYTYNPNRAEQTLAEIGIAKDDAGVMRDSAGNPIEFTLIVGVENNVGVDIANIFADELANVGITLNVRPTDFQKMVDSLLTSYDWDCALFSLGVNYWPSQGSNVWPSAGNLHFWYPLQESPATEWEAQVDRLYNEGRFTADSEQAQQIYDEYQRVLLEQLPLFYIVQPYSFLAVRNKWENVRFDTLNGLESEYLYLTQQ